MLGAAVVTWRRARAPGLPRAGARASSSCPPLHLARDLPAGALVGLLTGFFGVGGGFLVVPALAIALAFSMRLAVGTSLAIIVATSSIGLVFHLLAGRGLDLSVTAAMTASCVAGALGGAALAGRVPQRALGSAFAAVLASVAGYLLLSAAFLGVPPGS